MGGSFRMKIAGLCRTGATRHNDAVALRFCDTVATFRVAARRPDRLRGGVAAVAAAAPWREETRSAR
ncbi:hypothetical protein [Roseicella aquatilis]|uniref:Uncharacterized protein n=1 Tax=Roseicella aquatilis TaxID=2527868 RepID=A0A4R4D8C3_9PROT|nr:hypothetical protein [Roseicella aquatilis]TCZ55599.1 hypothetical protein EXY23_21365 [Roseicella aquatilis]